MELEMWNILRHEQDLTYTRDDHVMFRAGCIGHLRGDLGATGDAAFFTSWTDHLAILKTQDFKDEFDDVIHALRYDPEYCNVLKNRTKLAAYCYTNPQCRFEHDENAYGVRVDSEKYSYLLRLDPRQGVYNVYIYCYLRDALDKYLAWLTGRGYLSALTVAEFVLAELPEEVQQSFRDTCPATCDGSMTIGVYKEGFEMRVRNEARTTVFTAWVNDDDGILYQSDKPKDASLLWDFDFDFMPINPATLKRYTKEEV